MNEQALQGRDVETPDRRDAGDTLAATASIPDSVLRIPVSLQVVIGTARLPLSRIAQLTSGTTISLDQKLGAPATILVNGKEVAKGELFVLDGEDGGDRLAITITDILQPNRADGL